MPLKPNKIVTVNFTLRDEDGNILDSTENGKPFSYISGANQVMPILEKTVNRMKIGSRKKVKIEAKDAYGEYNEDGVQKLKVGMRYVANSPEHEQVTFTINEVKKNKVIVDFNHPLAGKDLEFEVELLDVRDATPEELTKVYINNQNGDN